MVMREATDSATCVTSIRAADAPGIRILRHGSHGTVPVRTTYVGMSIGHTSIHGVIIIIIRTRRSLNKFSRVGDHGKDAIVGYLPLAVITAAPESVLHEAPRAVVGTERVDYVVVVELGIVAAVVCPTHVDARHAAPTITLSMQAPVGRLSFPPRLEL